MLFIFDSSLIPELPQIGKSVTHHELMGWKIPNQTNDPQSISTPSNSSCKPTQPKNLIKRREPAGIQNLQKLKGEIKKDGMELKVTDGRISNSLNEKSKKIQDVDGGLRVKVLRRVSSLNDKQLDNKKQNEVDNDQLFKGKINEKVMKNRQLNTKKEKQNQKSSTSTDKSDYSLSYTHKRSASWSITSITPIKPMSDINGIAGQAASSSTFIKLMSDDTSIDIAKSLTDLYDLIPPSRLNPAQNLPKLPSSVDKIKNDLFDPSLLIIGLSFILECLVTERTSLQSSSSSSSSSNSIHPLSLPLLSSKQSVQLSSSKGGTGQLDWTTFTKYIHSVNITFHTILNMLSSMEITTRLLKLVDRLKMYVIKIKKVFGEIAELFMDHYGYLDGWWDEEWMRECAKYVGGWSGIEFLQ